MRPALPDYDAIRGLDSKFLRNAPKLSGIADTERMTYFDLQQRRLIREQGFDPAENTRIRKEENLAAKSKKQLGAAGEANRAMEEKKARIARIKMPLLKTRKPPTLTFDNSSYVYLSLYIYMCVYIYTHVCVRIQMPVLKTRKLPTLTFDNSSYVYMSV